jgi:hypothetical protein
MISRRIFHVVYHLVEGSQIRDLVLSHNDSTYLRASLFPSPAIVSGCYSFRATRREYLSCNPIQVGFGWKYYSKVGTNYVVSFLGLTEYWIERTTNKSIPSW